MTIRKFFTLTTILFAAFSFVSCSSDDDDDDNNNDVVADKHDDGSFDRGEIINYKTHLVIGHDGENRVVLSRLGYAAYDLRVIDRAFML